MTESYLVALLYKMALFASLHEWMDAGANPLTDAFTTLDLQNQSLNVSELRTIRRSSPEEALKLWKGRSGSRALCGIDR